ncbi:MAG: alpha/beta hydrolase [Phycisphaerae bacterium]|nr:alpha/beta hydrolase [Phycisphaerae bacterium]
MRQPQIQTWEHGSSGPLVIVLHGGPAAAGSARPMARELANEFRVLEPWQRGSGNEPLTVARHVADLHELIESRCGRERPALVGESWGAMLALAYAAEHPDAAGPLVLVGCGTFDTASRTRLMHTREQRITEEMREHLRNLEAECLQPAERIRRMQQVFSRADDYEPIVGRNEQDMTPEFDLEAHTETWNDMLRLQAEGVFPEAFGRIKSPVLMLHGDHDPHPGRMIEAVLRRHMPQLEYHELARCGHSPWNERHAREEFCAVLRSWLFSNIAPSSAES